VTPGSERQWTPPATSAELKERLGALAAMYDVNNLYATVQGEGAWSGTPMILLRLHNCPVGCPFCDTKHTWGKHSPGGELANDANYVADFEGHDWRGENARWTRCSAHELALLVNQEREVLGGKITWCMLTGGEPALQELGPLINALHRRGLYVNLETSGTALIRSGFIDWVCCSPKIGMPGGRVVLREAVRQADEIKFVIGRQSDIDKMDEFYASYGDILKANVRSSLQPMSASAKATALCVQTAIRRGWNVSIQTHKIMGVP
jgi:7-carboxy-7-deazaguanine synthase